MAHTKNKQQETHQTTRRTRYLEFQVCETYLSPFISSGDMYSGVPATCKMTTKQTSLQY